MRKLIDSGAHDCWACVHHATGQCDTFCDFGEAFELREDVKNAPAVDAVSKGLFDQIKWERDIAIGQLEQIGCQLGQKMDDVKTKLDAVPVVGYWIKHDVPDWKNERECSNCHCIVKVETCMGKPMYNFCPNCGAKMDGKKE